IQRHTPAASSRTASPDIACILFLCTLAPPCSTLFPYTTLFRSGSGPSRAGAAIVLVLLDDLGKPVQRFERKTPDTTIGRLDGDRSEEHTSELQSRVELVCRVVLEKK